MFRTFFLLFLVCSIFVMGCSEEPPQQSSETSQWASSSKVPFPEPVEVSIVQRESEPVPGLDGKVSVHIGDISDSRVLAKVVTTDGETLMPQTPMSSGSVHRFEYRGSVFAVQLIDLHNYLAGDDYATFRISTVAEEDLSSVDSDNQLTEAVKIARLIEKVESLEGAVFIRNGKEHTPPEAAKHMRDKWQWKDDEIETAEDFIRIAASESSISGEPYRIRFQDGKEVTSGEYLKDELRKLRED